MICGTYGGYQAHHKRGETACTSCRAAHLVYMREWRTKNPRRLEEYKGRTYSQEGHKRWNVANEPRRNEYRLLERYGITLKQWTEIFEWQGSRCACCGAVESHGRARQWQVDHDHATGQLRGIVCARCNRLLGQMGDKAATVLAHVSNLLAYLARSGDQITADDLARLVDSVTRHVPTSATTLADPDRPGKARHEART